MAPKMGMAGRATLVAALGEEVAYALSQPLLEWKTEERSVGGDLQHRGFHRWHHRCPTGWILSPKRSWTFATSWSGCSKSWSSWRSKSRRS